jgi:flagellar biogenesis protein FliO
MSPRPIAATGRMPVSATLRLVAMTAALLSGAVAFGQERSAFPETPRPVRRVDADLPVTLTGASASLSVPFSADPAKTPIRRITDESGDNALKPRSSWTVWAMLVVIVGAAAGLSLWTRRGGVGGHWKLPSTVFQVLGKSPVGPNQSVTLLRLGERVLLVSSSGPAIQTLAVVTDPVEVATITSECLSKRSAQLTELTRRPSAPVQSDAPAVAGSISGQERRARTKPEVNHA